MRSMLSACLFPAFHCRPSGTAAVVASARAGLCRRTPSRATVYGEIARSLDSLRAVVATGAVDAPARF